MQTRHLALNVAGAMLILSVLAAVRATGAHRTEPRTAAAPQLNDAPYRDGLYEGMLAARRGGASRPNVGRWNGAEERAHFVLGYERGYAQARGGSRP